MTKAELIARVAKDAKITKTAAAQAIDSITGTITKDLKRGEECRILTRKAGESLYPLSLLLLLTSRS